MVTVRTQIRTMYDHLQTLAMARQQIQDDRTWYVEARHEGQGGAACG